MEGARTALMSECNLVRTNCGHDVRRRRKQALKWSRRRLVAMAGQLLWQASRTCWVIAVVVVPGVQGGCTHLGCTHLGCTHLGDIQQGGGASRVVPPQNARAITDQLRKK